MNTKILQEVFSQKLVDKIRHYAYRPIQSKFIRYKLSTIFQRSNFRTERQWVMLIRDSRDVKIQFPRGISDYNFAAFVMIILENRQIFREIGPYFQAFCIQAIKNNPDILFNQYHAGMGPGQAYNIIISYLQTSLVFNTYPEFPQIDEHIFNVFKYIMEKEYLHYELPISDDQGAQTEKYFCKIDLQLDTFVTTKTAQTVELILSYIEDIIKIKNGPHFYGNKYQSPSNCVTKLLKIYSRDIAPHLIERRWFYPRYSLQQYFAKNFPMTKKTFWRILEMLDQRHPLFLSTFSEQLKQKFPKQLGVELILDLFHFPNLCSLFLNKNYIFSVFANRKVKTAEALWSNQSMRKDIVEMRIQGKNILEITADNFGLTHNLISMLWDSGYFDKMPKIRNKKSELIIMKKYNLTYNPDQTHFWSKKVLSKLKKKSE